MKFISDNGKTYSTMQECEAADKAHAAELARIENERKAKEAEKAALVAKRATRAKEVEDAYKAVVEAQKKYNALLEAFLKDYKTFHMTYNSDDCPCNSFSLLDKMFDDFYSSFPRG